MLNIFTIISIIVFLIINSIILFFIFMIRKKERIENVKLEDIKDIIIDQSLRHKLNFKLYHDFFEITNYMFYNLNPVSLNFYLYHKEIESDKTIIKFMYKKENTIKECDDNSLFDNVPISLFNVISKVYVNNNISIVKVKSLKDYDIDIHDRMKNCNIKTLYFKNLYRQNSNIPYGFLLLPYKEEKMNDQQLDIFITESNKLSINLSKILDIYSI